MAVNPKLEGSLSDKVEGSEHLTSEVKDDHTARRVPPWAPFSDSGAAVYDSDLGRSSAGGLNTTGSAARHPPPRRRSASRQRGRDSPIPPWEWGSRGGRSKSPQDLSRSRGPPAKAGAVLHPVGSAAGSAAYDARATRRR